MEYCLSNEREINLSIGSKESRKMEKKVTVRHGVVVDPSLVGSGLAQASAKAERMRAFWAETGGRAFAAR